MIRSVSILSTFILFSAVISWAARAEVVLESEVNLPTGRIHLGDIAEITGDANLVQRLRTLEVGRIEAAGRTTRVTSNALKSFYLPSVYSADSITVNGAVVVQVTARFREVEQDSLAHLVLQAIEPHMANVAPGDYSVETSKFPSHIRVPDQDFQWNVDIPARFDGRGDEFVSVQVMIDGKVQSTYSLPILVRRWGTVAQALQPIQRGQPVQASQVALKRIEITRQNRTFINKLDDVIGRSALRTIARDQNLLDSWFEKPFAVRAGEQIRLRVQAGGADLSVLGTARVNGYVGQRIEVENIQSHKRLQGLVEAPGTVRIAE